MNDMQQMELDLFEKKLLTDLFGGYEPERFIIKFGIFKYDLSDKVQKYITLFEELAVPCMNEQGLVDVKKLKNIISDKIPLPDNQFRLVDVYSKVSPFVLKMKGI